MKPGYYEIKHDGFILPARWDGEKWHHEKGTSFPHHEHDNVCHKDGVPIQIFLGQGCPTGCSCTQNSDGSVTTKCT